MNLMGSLHTAFIALAFSLICAIFSQNLAVSIHQGQHFAQSVQTDAAGLPTLDEGACPVCSILKNPSETPTPAVVLAEFIPLVSKATFIRPIDPKTNISRTCDARGPPLLSLS